ncbi:AraC family transcriptional regulator [Flammeovirga sp. SubArs3]|uniref:helix-turn-helix transcriptional regulator n=1 Tax=Flammeovirga sp. SubArs3 TaxID=2995316 RepID=UPI00248B6AC4|nr:AraC family transcriptional regulator [Flammeovirga sp. SubArs3]
MHNILNYWRELVGGQQKDGKITIPSEHGEGTLDAYKLSSNFDVARLCFKLNKDISGATFIMEDDEDFYPIIFSHKSSVIFEGKYQSVLNGALLSNNKQNIRWTLPANQRVEMVFIRVRKSYFREIVAKSEALQKVFPEGKTFTVFEELTTLIRGAFFRILEQKESLLFTEFLEDFVRFIFHLLMDQISSREMIKNEEYTSINIQLVFKARDMILNNNGTPLDVDHIARECGMSNSNLRLQFKSTFGIPIYQFQQQVRLDSAKELLKRGEKSIRMIAMDLGFSNSSHFASVFKKEVGTTPKQYQKQLPE